MKKLTKLLALGLALALALALAVPVWADEEGGEGGTETTPTTTGTITINNAVVGQTYRIYRILDLESYSDVSDKDEDDLGNPTGGNYAYKATTAWSGFINGDSIKGVYVNVDDQGYVTWVDGASAADFAKAAQAYAAKNNISSILHGTLKTVKRGEEETTEIDTDKSSSDNRVAYEDGKLKFSNLGLGYYLVDSTLGTLCSLDTTNPDVTIKEKNGQPTNEKKVEEDSKTGTDGAWGSTNDADIGQTVNFKSTITAQAGAENYVFHDKMDAGLTFGGSVTVTLNGAEVNATFTNTDDETITNYTFTDYTKQEVTASTDGCTFEVAFTQAFCDTLKANDQIVISYTATVNENAVVGGDGNKNESKIEYGESGKTTTTPPSETKTYTWKVDVFKYTEGKADDEGKKTEVALAGATFTLSKKSGGTDPIALVAEGNNVYRVATADDTDTVTKITTDATGKFTIKGLDSDTYYLTETAAPAGYNKLADPITIVIGENGVVNGTTDASQGVKEVKVLNQTGAELPSTGGMGTTLFYVLGGILVVVAGVLLVTKKRMNNQD